VIDADQLDRVVDLVDEVLDGCAARRRPLAIDLGEAAFVLGAPIR